MQLSRAQVIAVALGVPVGLAMLGTTSGFAQALDPMTKPGGVGMATQQNLKTLNKAEKPEIQPPSLPGTKGASEAAPPVMSPTDMSPTEALFDAINRGDVAAARDAVNRGADMHGQNVLGLTPLELSVDLGRNDISFLLLSMRDEDPSSRAATRRGGTLARADQSDAILRAGAASRPAMRSRAAAISPEESEAASPRLFSGNGGAPIPAAGFVGFDTGRSGR